ncbi:PAS domain S-box protein [bacterium]
MNQVPKVLIVEDEAIIAQDLKTTLMNLDYDVVDIVNSGDKALEVLDQESIDVILMDIRIKGDKNGIETTSLINEKFNVPVIFLTAYADVETMERIKNTDAYGFIVKPASEQTIRGSIDLALYKHGLDQRLREREERLAHLNQVLLAIRNVDQLITKEKDVHKLIQGACDNLIQSLGYSRAWIALYDGQDKLSTFSYAGFNNSVDPLEKLLRKDISQYPLCIQNAYETKNEMIITDTDKDCEDCALNKEYRQYSRFSMCLTYSGKMYGVMSVAVPSMFVFDKEEQALFDELVNDVAFALYRIELEEKRYFAETMLKNRERTLSTLMNNLPGMAFRRLNDKNCSIKFVSNGCKQLTGYRPIDLIDNKNLTFADMIHPDDCEMVKKNIQQAIEGNRQFDLNYRIVTVKDEIKWVWERGSFIGEYEEQFQVLEGVIHDITEQRIAEEALRKEKAFTEMALNTQTDTFFVFDPETGKAVRWNKTFENVSGYNTKEIAELPAPISYYSENDIAKAIQFIDQFTIEKEDMLELSLITKDSRSIPYEYRVTSIQDPETQKIFLVSVGRDITERKKAEVALRESEEKLRNIIEHSNELYFIHDTENKLNFVSPQCEQIMGYTTDEMKVEWTQLTTDNPANELGFQLTMKAIETGKRQPCYPLEVRKKSGDHIWVEIDESPLKDDLGNVVGMVGAVRDITVRKQAEQNLKESEGKYRALIENMTDNVFMIDRQNRLLSVNHAAARFLNKDPEQLVGETIFNLFPKSLAEKYALSLEQVFQSGKPLDNEGKTMVQNHELWLASSLSPVKDDEGNVSAVIGVSRNISSRKQIEEALVQSEARYRAIVEDQTEFIIRWLPNGTRTYVNNAYCRYYGKSFNELVGENFFPLIHENDLGRLKAKIKALTPENSVATDEHRRVMPDGEIRWHQWTDRAIFNEKGKVCEIQSVGRDITQMKLAEDELRHTNVRMKAILENTDQFIMIANKDGKPVMYNSAYSQIMKEMIGLDMQPGIQPHQLIQDSKVRKWWDNLHKKVLSGEKFDIEFAYPDPNGNFRYFEIHFHPILEENEIRGFTEFTREITDRKKTELALKESEGLLKKIAENHPHSYLSIINKDLTIGFSSGQEFKRQGIDPNDYVGLSLEDVFGEYSSIVKEHYLKTFGGEETTFELNMGEQYLLYNSVPLFNENGEIDRILVVVENITDRKCAEETILQGLEELREVQKVAKLGSWQISLPGKRIRWSEEVFHIFELNPQMPEPSLDEFWEFVHPDDLKFVRKNIKTQFKPFQGEYHYEYRILLKGGTIKHIDHIVKQECDANGKIIKVYGMVQDITERKQVEIALKENEERTKRLAEATFEGIGISRQGKIVDVNQQIMDIYGYSRKEFLKKSFQELVHPDDLNMVFSNIKKNVTTPYEHRGIHKDGSILFLEVRGKLIFIKNETYRLTVIRDITHRKLTEESLKQKMTELEKFNKLMVGRENKMIELKHEVNVLCKELGRRKKYRIPDEI